MKITKQHMRLYAVTDSTWLNGRHLNEVVRIALQNGVTCLQLREKNLGKRDFIELAKEIRPVCSEFNVPFIINDYPEIAKEIDADGVHVGQDDMDILRAREILGSEKIIGTSAHNVTEALKAQQLGADYIGVGAVFGSTTKLNATNLLGGELNRITKAVSIPVVAIGGISKNNISNLFGTGIDGVAVISSIFASDDIASATREILALSKQI